MKKTELKGKENFAMSRSRFLKLSTLMTAMPLLGKASIFGSTQTFGVNPKKQAAMNTSKAFADLLHYPFLNALFGRRGRRFGLGMEIPSGPLAYRSEKEPVPLSETEQMLLVAAATGVSGWNFGVPLYEALCPPFYPDMHAAVKVFVERKFGDNGAYKPDTSGPLRNSEEVKKTIEPYSEDFVDCMSEVAQYIYQKFGKFPVFRSTIMMPGFVQAHHLDTDFYDKYYKEGSYLQSHVEHMEK